MMTRVMYSKRRCRRRAVGTLRMPGQIIATQICQRRDHDEFDLLQLLHSGNYFIGCHAQGRAA